jgi:hypothetical protein
LKQESVMIAQPQEAPANANQIMISYCWGKPPHPAQQAAREVERFLKSKGFTVWRDEHSMKSDVYDAMANAVKQSATVLVILTPDYALSDACKSELTFAKKCHRKIVPCYWIRITLSRRMDGSG